MTGEKKYTRKGRKIFYWFLLLVFLALAAFFYFRFYYVFGQGVKSGQLNFIVYKGYVFKTYEGRMIQAGYHSTEGVIQSNEFDFSVTDPDVARQLELNSGKVLDLHYKEYLGRLPWRGMSRYVVDRVEGVGEAADRNPPPPAELPTGL